MKEKTVEIKINLEDAYKDMLLQRLRVKLRDQLLNFHTSLNMRKKPPTYVVHKHFPYNSGTGTISRGLVLHQEPLPKKFVDALKEKPKNLELTLTFDVPDNPLLIRGSETVKIIASSFCDLKKKLSEFLRPDFRLSYGPRGICVAWLPFKNEEEFIYHLFQGEEAVNLYKFLTANHERKTHLQLTIPKSCLRKK